MAIALSELTEETETTTRPVALSELTAEPEPDTGVIGRPFAVKRQQRQGVWGLNPQLDGVFSGRTDITNFMPADVAYNFGEVVGFAEPEEEKARASNALMYSVMFGMPKEIAFDNQDSLNKEIFGKALSPTAAWRHNQKLFNDTRTWVETVKYGKDKLFVSLKSLAAGKAQMVGEYLKTVQTAEKKPPRGWPVTSIDKGLSKINDAIGSWIEGRPEEMLEWSKIMQAGVQEFYQNNTDSVLEVTPGLGYRETIRQYVTDPKKLAVGLIESSGIMVSAVAGTAVGGPAGGITATTVFLIGDTYTAARKDGTDVLPAMGEDIFGSVIEAGIEQWTLGKKLGLLKNAKKIVSSGLPKVMWESTKAFFRGTAEEGSQQFERNFWRWVFTDRTQEWTEAVAESAAAGGPMEMVMAGGFSAVGLVVGPAVPKEEQLAMIDKIETAIVQGPANAKAQKEMIAEVEKARKDVNADEFPDTEKMEAQIAEEEAAQAEHLAAIAKEGKKPVKPAAEPLKPTEPTITPVEAKAGVEGEVATRVKSENIPYTAKPVLAYKFGDEIIYSEEAGIHTEIALTEKEFNKVVLSKEDPAGWIYQGKYYTREEFAPILQKQPAAEEIKKSEIIDNKLKEVPDQTRQAAIDLAAKTGENQYIRKDRAWHTKGVPPKTGQYFTITPEGEITYQEAEARIQKPEEKKEPDVEKIRKELEEREAEQTDEQLSGITKKRRAALIKETSVKIKAHDIYQTELAAQEVRERQVGPGFYFVHESGRGEVEAVLESLPKGRLRDKIKKMFTFNRDDLQAKGGSAVAWDVAVQEGLITETEERGEMDLSEFVQRVVESVSARGKAGALNEAALRAFAESGYPDAVMLAEKFRMLKRGASDIEINEMITEWAEFNKVPIESVLDEFINADKMIKLAEMSEEEQDAELERLATEQILAEDQMAAQEAAKDILEANDIKAEVRPVEEIQAGLAEVRARDISRDMLGREVIKPLSGKQLDLGIGKGTVDKAEYKPTLVKAISKKLDEDPKAPSSPTAMLTYLKEQKEWESLFNNYLKPQAEMAAAWDEAVLGQEFTFERMRGRPTGAAMTIGQREVILLALGADLETGAHEGWHLLRNRLTEVDLAVLEKQFGKDIAGEEAEAAAFGEFYSRNKAPSTAIRKIFEKIKQILAKIRSALEGKGFRTVDDIFGEAVAGRIQKAGARIQKGVRFEAEGEVVFESQKEIFFHGTSNAAKIRSEGFKKQWTHLTDSKKIADSYQAWVRGDSPETLRVSFQPKNPAYFDAEGTKYTEHKANLAYHIGKAAAKAEKEGHDALVVKNIRDHFDSSVPTQPHTTIIVFDPTKIELIAKQIIKGVRFEIREPAPVYFSKLKRAVTTSMPNKMSSEAFRGWAAKQGIKKDEMLWTGVEELLAKQETVTKADVYDTITLNEIQIEVVVKGGKEAKQTGRNRHEIDLDLINVERKINVIKKRFTDLMSAFPEEFLLTEHLITDHYSRQALVNAAAGFQGWGAPNLEERRARQNEAIRALEAYLPNEDVVALRFLSEEHANLKAEAAVAQAAQHAEGRTQFAGPTLNVPGGTNYREVLLRLPERLEDALKGPAPVFTEGHYRETGVLAHFRMDDRTDKSGNKVLFIQEIQSDWHQIGQKKGYKGDKLLIPDGYEVMTKEVEGRTLYALSTTETVAFTRKDENTAWLPFLEDAIDLVVGRPITDTVGQVPDAPFKKTWHELAFKRILRFAADEGYDKVAWTTGQMQADRYDLSKYVEIITAAKGKAGVSITATTKTGANVIDSKFVQENELDGIVGKDLADKIRAQKDEFHSYTGLELKVGGEFHKQLYDVKIPAFAKKYMKKWGVKGVGETEIYSEIEGPEEITPDLMQRAANAAKENNDVVAELWLEGHAFDEQRTWPDVPGVKKQPKEYIVRRDVSVFTKPAGKVHSVLVTAAMKESVEAGQVMFETSGQRLRREAEQRGRINARKERLAAQAEKMPTKKKKKKKVSRAKIKINIRETTPALTPELEAALLEKPAEIPGGVYVYPEPKPGELKKAKVKLDERFLEAQRDRMTTTAREKFGPGASKVALGLNKALIAMSQRLEKIDPTLKFAARRYVFDMQRRIIALQDLAFPMVNAWRKFKGDKRDFQFAAWNGMTEQVSIIAAKHGATDAKNQFREVMDEIHRVANELGMEMNYDVEHWPREVKDFDGLIEYLQTTERWSPIQQALIKRQEQAGGRKLTDDEQMQVINTLLRGFRVGGVTLSRPGEARERTIEVLDRHIERFYYNFDEGISVYIQNMMQAAGAREFFGKTTNEIRDLKAQKSRLATSLYKATTRIGLKKAIPVEKHEEHISERRKKFEEVSAELEKKKTQGVEDTIGYHVMNLHLAGKLTYKQQKELGEMYLAIFKPKGASGAWRNFIKLSYIDTLANTEVAITQLEEMGLSVYKSKTKSIPALARAFTGRSKVTMKEMTITDVNQYIQDLGFATIGNKLLFALRMADKPGKEALGNVVIDMAREMAAEPNAAFKQSMKYMFGSRAEQVMRDLKNGKTTDDIRFIGFNGISDYQPVSIVETPETFARGGNWRVLYMLRQFTLYRFGILVRKTKKLMVNPAKDPATYIKGAIDLMQFIAILTAFGVGKDVIRSWYDGDPFEEDDLWDSVTDNLLQFVLLSKWTARKIDREGPGAAIGSELMPPTKSIDNLYKDFKNREINKSVRSIPYIGERYYQWIGGGREKGGGGILK